MSHPPVEIVDYFAVRYFCEISKKWVKTRWTMSEEDAHKRFQGQQYEILTSTREKRRIGGDPDAMCFSNVLKSAAPKPAFAMKATVLRMRSHGIALERGEMKQAMTHSGELEVCDTRENNLNRIVRMAFLRDDAGREMLSLFDVHILWLSANKMGLSGFERRKVEGKWVDYAQTWVCLLFDKVARDNDNILPRQENWRN